MKDWELQQCSQIQILTLVETCMQVTWKEQIGEGNEQVSHFKQAVEAMSENLFAARSAQAWDKVTVNNDETWCPNNTYFEFAPETVASVTPSAPQKWTGSCFYHMGVKLASKGDGNYSLTLNGSDPISLLCSDTYMMTTSYTILGILDISPFDSSQTLSFSVQGSLKELDINRHGVHVMVSGHFCSNATIWSIYLCWLWSQSLPCGILGTVESIIKTASLFVGEGEPLLERNAEFLKYKGVSIQFSAASTCIGSFFFT